MDLFHNRMMKPMLIKNILKPFNSPDYIYELKLDGIRCLVYLDETHTDIRNRKNDTILPRFPELMNLNAFSEAKCILDGELIVINNGLPDYVEVQRRSFMRDPLEIELAVKQYPACFVAYDLIYMNNKSLTNLPLMNRKKLLDEIIIEDTKLAVSRYVPEQGIKLFKLAKQENLEGVIAKIKTSKYYPDKRTKEWITFQLSISKDFVICGYMATKDKDMICLILGQYRGNELLYKGHITFRLSPDFSTEYKCVKIERSPFRLTPSGFEEAIWLEPQLVCIVQYLPNGKGIFRLPVFKGIRDDKTALECQED